MAALVSDLRRRGQEAGLAAVGVAPATPMDAARRALEERKAAGLSAGMQFTYRNPARSTDPGLLLPGAAALVVGAWPYGDAGGASPETAPVDDTSAGGPKGRVARYACRDHYRDLRAALEEMAALLRQSGWAARVVADDNALVDRAAAERAGLGWFGKNANILLPGRGSWFLHGSVATDAPLLPDAPVGDGCGPCRRCLSSCPTGAIVAPGVLDARRCLAWLLQATGVFPFEFRAALGDRMYGCDDCQEVCPANRVAARMAGSGRRGPEPGAGAAGAREAGAREAGAREAGTDGSAVDILDVLTAPDDALLGAYGRWYIPQRDPRYLRRNALIVLGNVGDGRHPEVERTLRRYLAGPDEMLRAHAVWAAVRTGRRDLVDEAGGLRDDPSPMVQDELRRTGAIEARAAGTKDPGSARTDK